MTKENNKGFKLPSQKAFFAALDQHEKYYGKDIVYEITSKLLKSSWGHYADMAKNLGIMLLIWNQAHYRYGLFDYNALEKCLAANIGKIEKFKRRRISTLSEKDRNEIIELFDNFSASLAYRPRPLKKPKPNKSPTGAAKALHFLAPKFFPLWDRNIALEYGCRYGNKAGESYADFCFKIKDLAGKAANYYSTTKEPLLRSIDKYNFETITVLKQNGQMIVKGTNN